MKCARTACQWPLDRGYWEIYNDPSTGLPRLYCIKCGRKIMEYNAIHAASGGIKLEGRIVDNRKKVGP